MFSSIINHILYLNVDIFRVLSISGVTGRAEEYTTIIRTIKSILAEEGFIQGLFKGLSMNWIKGPIAVGVSFMTFDITQRWLRKFEFFHTDDGD